VNLQDFTRLRDGIEPSGHPILAVRRRVYDVSVARRIGGWKGQLTALERGGSSFALQELYILLE
jgi:hypothetical protein